MKMPDASSDPARVAELVARARREVDEQPGDEVREDEVERPVAGRQAALAARVDPPRDAGCGAALARGRLDRDRVGVDAEDRAAPKLGRGDRQDPGAAADVEHARAVEQAVVGQRLERREAEPRRRVEAGPEGHARVEGE